MTDVNGREKARVKMGDGNLVPVRVANCLLNELFPRKRPGSFEEAAAQIRPEDVVEHVTREQLLAVDNFGLKSLRSVEAWLAKSDLKLRSVRPPRALIPRKELVAKINELEDDADAALHTADSSAEVRLKFAANAIRSLL